MLRAEEESATKSVDMLPPGPGQVHVTVVGADGLMPTDGDTANPFVLVSLGQQRADAISGLFGDVKKRTATQTKTLSPRYEDEAFTFPVAETHAPESETQAQMRERVKAMTEDCTLCVQVWDTPKSYFDVPNFLGEASVDLVSEFGKEWLTKEVSQRFVLLDRDFRTEPMARERRLKARNAAFQDQLDLGTVELKCRFELRTEKAKPWWADVGEALDGVLEGLGGLLAAEQDVAEGAELEATARLCPLGHELRYRVEDGLTDLMRRRLPPADGVLTVRVVGCSNLLPADESGLSDPFVQLSMLDKTVRTRTVKHSLRPEFDQSFEWQLVKGAIVPPLAVRVFDADWGGFSQRFLGEVDPTDREAEITSIFGERWLDSDTLTRTLRLHDTGRGRGEPQVREATAVEELEKRMAMGLEHLYGSITMAFSFALAPGASSEPASDAAQSVAGGQEDSPDRLEARRAENDADGSPGGSPDQTDDGVGGETREEEDGAATVDHGHTSGVREDHVELRHASHQTSFCCECFSLLPVGSGLFECSLCNFSLCVSCGAERSVRSDDESAGADAASERLAALQARLAALKGAAPEEPDATSISDAEKESLASRAAAALVLLDEFGDAAANSHALVNMQKLVGRLQVDDSLAHSVDIRKLAERLHDITTAHHRLNDFALPPTGAPLLSPAEARR